MIEKGKLKKKTRGGGEDGGLIVGRRKGKLQLEKKRNAKEGREMRKEGRGRKGEGRQAKRRRKSKEATKEVHEK